MKKVETIAKNDKLGSVIDAMKEAGAKGVSITQIKGKGSTESPMIRGRRGTTQYRAEYNTMNSIMTVVNDTQVPAMIKAISNSAHTEGSSGDGIIMVTNVEDIINISSLSTGSDAL